MSSNVEWKVMQWVRNSLHFANIWLTQHNFNLGILPAFVWLMFAEQLLSCHMLQRIVQPGKMFTLTMHNFDRIFCWHQITNECRTAFESKTSFCGIINSYKPTFTIKLITFPTNKQTWKSLNTQSSMYLKLLYLSPSHANCKTEEQRIHMTMKKHTEYHQF